VAGRCFTLAPEHGTVKAIRVAAFCFPIFRLDPGRLFRNHGKESNESFTPHLRRNLQHAECSLPQQVDNLPRISAFQRYLPTSHQPMPARGALIPDDGLHQLFGSAGRALRSHRQDQDIPVYTHADYPSGFLQPQQ
jgi:hypothetical protein